MNNTQMLDVMRAHKDEILVHSATALYLFGSRARGTAGAGSDLDLFVDYDPGSRFSLFNLVRIQRVIQELTGVQADVTTRDSLRREARREIEREAIRVF